MAGMTSANIITAARVNLREAAASVWADADMTAWVAQVAREIARKSGLPKRTCLAITEYTKNVALGDLPYIDINQIEYPVSDDIYQPIYRPYRQFGTTLILDIDTLPTITDGTLTGTVTFTQNSCSVTGAATLFTTELQDGYLIQVGKVASAAYKWYQVMKVVSATALTLVDPFEEADNIDTVSLTKYRDSNSCARVYYTGDYTVSTTSDMPAKYDELAILGIVAHAAQEYAAYKVATNMTDVTAKITLAAAEITTSGKAAAQLVLAISDILAARTSFNTTNSAVIATDLTAIGTALNNCLADLDAGIALIATASPGGDVTGKYTDAAKVDVEEAKARVEKVKTYIDVTKPNLDMAVQELQAAAGYINSATSYLQMADRDLNADRMITAYQRWADKKWNAYQEQLNNVGSVKVRHFGSREV